MQFLQNINGGTAVLVAVGLCALCLILPFLLTGLHFITAIIGLFTHFLSGIGHIVSGGPVAWCGCLVAIGGCGFIALAVWLITTGVSNCATMLHPTNFCTLLTH